MRKKRKFQYDVALSYAGENERYVAAVYRNLIAKNVAAFFAPAKTSELWGEDEREFQRIYGPGSRYVVPFISEDYINKEWPRLEFRAARKEAALRDTPSILPVRLDDAVLPGLRRKVQYVDGRRFTPKEVATFLIAKLESEAKSKPTSDATQPPSYPRLLSAEDTQLLGLLETATYPLGAKQLQALFPEVRWVPILRRWRRQKLVTRGRHGFLTVSRDVAQRLLRDKPATVAYRERWIETLTPLAGHIDTGLMLALEYVGARRIDEAINVLTDLADGMEPGFWNDLYLNTFAQLGESSFVAKAKAEVRVLFHNAYGMLLTRSGKPQEALAQFTLLRQLSKRTGNQWGEGQSYINAGVAAANSGDVPGAMAWYGKAAAHGRRHRDGILTGRSLGNMANFVAPREATKLLDESERLKRRAGDVVGLAGTLVVRGNAAAAEREFAVAAKYYRRAIALSKQLDLRHVRVVALRNLGRTEVDRNRPKRAYPFYDEAKRLCKEEGFTADLAHVIAGDAIAHAEARDFVEAEKRFRKLADLHRAVGLRKEAVVALHDAGAMLLHRGRRSEAFQQFERVIAEARSRGFGEWVYRTQLDAATAAADDKTATALLRVARRGAALKKDVDAVIIATARLAEMHLADGEPEKAIDEIDVALRTLPAPSGLPLRADRFGIVIDTKNDRKITGAFRALVRVSRAANDHERTVDAHMALGDYLWEKNALAAKKNAYHAYAVAMTDAASLGVETLISVGGHMVRRLHAASRQDPTLLREIEKDTRRWIAKQTLPDPALFESLFLWPLRVVERIAPLSKTQLRQLSAKKIARIMTEEFKRALTATRTVAKS